ncbi:MAG: PQQ-binding-like beta-propeller repeat protein, partial [bacterium]
MFKRLSVLIVLTGVSGCATSPPIILEIFPLHVAEIDDPGPRIKHTRLPISLLDHLHVDLNSDDFFHLDLDSVVYSYKGITQFRGNPQHTFYGIGQIPANEPEILWRFRTGQTFSKTLPTPWEGLGWTGQPAVSVETNGTFVYVASLDGHIYKLDFPTGEEICSTAENYNIIKSSPAVTDTYVIFGSWDNRVHVLDRNTFELLHADEAFYTPSASYDFDSSPVVEGEFLYFGGEDGYVRKIHLQPPFERIWVYPDSTPQSDFTYGKSKKPYVGIES